MYIYVAILTRALIVSLTEEEQSLIDKVAEQVVNGGKSEEMKIKAQSMSNKSLR